MKMLVPCHYLVASGGLLRFERVGRVLRKMGHTLVYLPSDPQIDFEPHCPVVTFSEARAISWDATLIPGAGFPAPVIESFRNLREENFGVRIQMVLNDQHMRERFLLVNEVFAPDIVIFNNEHWQYGSYRDFHAQHFHHLVGAVDTTPLTRRRDRKTSSFVLGAQLSKNPQPVLDALAMLPEEFQVRFFGHAPLGRACEPTERFGARVEFAGALFDAALARYYDDLDAMVSTEERAGWANVVAEAMAAGVPVITTPAGALSIASHRETALVLGRATGDGIAKAAIWGTRSPFGSGSHDTSRACSH